MIFKFTEFYVNGKIINFQMKYALILVNVVSSFSCRLSRLAGRFLYSAIALRSDLEVAFVWNRSPDALERLDPRSVSAVEVRRRGGWGGSWRLRSTGEGEQNRLLALETCNSEKLGSSVCRFLRLIVLVVNVAG